MNVDRAYLLGILTEEEHAQVLASGQYEERLCAHCGTKVKKDGVCKGSQCDCPLCKECSENPMSPPPHVEG